MRGCHNSANEKPLYFKLPVPSVDSVYYSLPKFLSPCIRVLLYFYWRLARGFLQLYTSNYNFLLILNKLIFATEITGSLFVLGQHFGSPYGDPEKTPDNSKAGEQTDLVHTWSPLLLTAFLANPGV